MSTLSDVLPPSASNKDALPAPAGPKQGAIERLQRRMENYREMQSNRLPQYNQTMNQVNVQQLQDTKLLRQKFLESKAKKPNKKSSSNSSEKLKHDSMNAMSNMNGMMQFHGPQPGGPQGGPHLGPPHPLNHAGHGGSQHVMHHAVPQKRPLDEDTKNTPDTAKRLNLDNGNNSSDAVSLNNSIKREPSPMESKFQPGGKFPSNSVQQQQTSSNNSISANNHISGSEQSSDIKPKIKTEDVSGDAPPPPAQPPQPSPLDEADSKIKAEVDSLKQEDTLGDLDLKDFDGFDGMDNDAFKDLMGDLQEFDTNFIETLDFGDNPKNGVDEGEIDEKLAEAGFDPTTTSMCHTSAMSMSDSSQPSNVSTMSRMGGGGGVSTASSGSQPNAAEALKLMAQQHQQPNMDGPPSMPGGPGPYPGQMYGDRSQYPPSSGGMEMPVSSSGEMPSGPPGGMMVRPRLQDGDPRLRAAVQQRFRLGNPNSVANSMSGMGMGMHQGGPMSDQQRMEMMRGGAGMMGMGQNPAMQQNMGMMSQQQVSSTANIRAIS